MTTQACVSHLPDSSAFRSESAPLRSPAPLTPREETQLHLLAREIVHHAPWLAQRLAGNGRRKLRSQLEWA